MRTGLFIFLNNPGKHIFFIIFFLICGDAVMGGGPTCTSAPVCGLQNPGFEDRSSCPSGISQITSACTWISPTAGTPDYYSNCAAPATTVSTPVNGHGAQTPRTGGAYGGIGVFFFGNGREYLQSQLAAPLTAGQTYQVEFWVSMAENYLIAIQEIGAYFSVLPVSLASADTLPYIPQIENSSGVIMDELNWVRISGSFCAAGGENYITIGNFRGDGNTTRVNSGTFPPDIIASYYYVDDVCITNTGPCALPVDIVSFTCGLQQGGIVISWTTAAETNNDYFTVERSADGTDFTGIGKVKGAGNSSSAIFYEFTNPLTGSWLLSPVPLIYYRLKQTGYDGNFSYSNTISIAPGKETPVTNLYLDPFGDILNYVLSLEQDEIITVAVTDVQGIELMRKTTEAAKGTNTHKLNTGSLSTGMYFLRINTGSSSPVSKFVKQ